MSTATLKEWLAEDPPPDSAFKQTLAHVSERVRSGEDPQFASAVPRRVPWRPGRSSRPRRGHRAPRMDDSNPTASWTGLVRTGDAGVLGARDCRVAGGVPAARRLHLGGRSAARLSSVFALQATATRPLGVTPTPPPRYSPM